jgi:hypothetical protein
MPSKCSLNENARAWQHGPMAGERLLIALYQMK